MIKAKFGWNKDEATLYNTIISSSAIFGVVTGSLLGGKFITFGRRRSIIVFNIFSAMATTLTMFLNLPMICIGRYLFGMCCGVFSVAGPKMLDETIPVNLISSFGTATNSMMAAGIMIAIVLGLFLPEGDDLQGQLDDGNWRVLYGFPYICQVITILIFTFVFKQESITYSIANNDDEQALALIKRVYSSKEDP